MGGGLFILHPTLQRKVPETAYLNEQNTHRYRPILRYFYLQHTAHRYWLPVEEVLDFVRANVDPECSEDRCHQDLDQLHKWNNLLREQESPRGRTIEEFLRRRLRYQLTPYTIALERLLVDLETAQGTRGSLDPTLLDHLWERLAALRQRLDATDETAVDTAALRSDWKEAFRYFERIRNDANDYLSAMQARRPRDLQEMERFLAFKDVLVEYLSSFVNELLETSDRVRKLFATWQASGAVERLVNAIVDHEVAHLPDLNGQKDPERTGAEYRNQLAAVAEWFRSGGGVDLLARVTGEAVETVVRHTQRLLEQRRLALSRRRELERLALAFSRCANLDEAHRLAAQSFACAVPRHFLGEAEEIARDEAGSAWKHEPRVVTLVPIRRGPRAPSSGAAIPDRSEGKAALLREARERQRRERALWDALFQDGWLSLDALDLAEIGVRTRILDVLGRCLAARDKTAIATDGSRIQLHAPEPDARGLPYGEIRAPDGVLVLPAWRLFRRGGDAA